MTPRAAPLSPDARRQAIVEAVVPLLVEHGHTCTTRQIAEAAGIAEGTIYRAFPDKLALWEAAARHVLDPDVEVAELREVAEGRDDLRSLVVGLADHLFRRSQRVMGVVGVWRGASLAADGERERMVEAVSQGQKPRPPQFLMESNRALMNELAALLGRHEAELSVPPETAAGMLRTLAIGQRHPGAFEQFLLSPEEIADLMLDGIRSRERAPERTSA